MVGPPSVLPANAGRNFMAPKSSSSRDPLPTTPPEAWEPLLRFGQTTIQDKVLFGSGWFLLGRPPVTIVEEFRALPVRPEVLDRWLHGNAERLLEAGCGARSPATISR